jgi:glycosyltransferase involved in cell wall biosynthesis
MSKKNKIKVLHILPAMNIGGVETAIYKSIDLIQKEIDYSIVTVLFKGGLNCNQISILKLFSKLFYSKRKWFPDVVVTSLWIAHPFGYFFKLFGVKWVAFFHNSSFTHLADKIVLPFSARSATKCICDSSASKNFMNNLVIRDYDVVPYIFENKEQKSLKKNIDFVWIGRNHYQKRLDLVCDLIILLSKRFSNINLNLIISGDTYPPFESLKSIIPWNIEVNRNISNEMVLDILKRSKFYLLLSDFEGMSMSTIEAIQNGCVPIVRPVGEISNYLDSNSAIIIDEISEKGFENICLKVEKIFYQSELQASMNKLGNDNINKFGKYSDSFIKSITS